MPQLVSLERLNESGSPQVPYEWGHQTLLTGLPGCSNGRHQIVKKATLVVVEKPVTIQPLANAEGGQGVN